MQATIDLSSLREDLLAELRTLVGAPRPADASPWLTVKKAAVYLGISEDATRGLIKRREIQVYRPNGRVFIHRDELDAWVMAGKDG